MADETALDLDFADGKYRFWLPMPRVIEIERKADRSIFAIYDDLAQAVFPQEGGGAFVGGTNARLGEIREVIRQGLIGGAGGVVDGEAVEVNGPMAGALLDGYAYPNRPAADDAELALYILDAAVRGVRLKKKAETKAEEAESPSP